MAAATENQTKFMETLETERDTIVEDLGWDREQFEDDKFGAGRASLAIKELLTLPKAGE